VAFDGDAGPVGPFPPRSPEADPALSRRSGRSSADKFRPLWQIQGCTQEANQPLFALAKYERIAENQTQIHRTFTDTSIMDHDFES
jgi:hypothetical protein